VLMLVWVGTASAAGPTLPSCRASWADSFADFASFNLYIGSTSGGPYVKVGTWPGTSPPTFGPTGNLCLGLSDGQKFLVVKAVNAAGTEGPASNEVPFVLLATVPNAPSSLTVQP